jgi:hypothetical protein
MAGHRITLRLEGTEHSDDNLWVTDFLRELEALRNALRKTEEVLSGRSVLEWRVVDLSHSSPAAVTIEPVYVLPFKDVEPPAAEQMKERVVSSFFGYFASISANRVPPELDRPALEAYQEMAAPVRQQNVKATVSNGRGEPFVIEPIVQEVVTIALLPTMHSEGSLKGRLEFLNIHAQQNVFRIYSPLVPRYVACHFPKEHLEAAKDAIGKKIYVSGNIAYRNRDPYPQSIEVRDISVLPEDSELPLLMSLRGLQPGVTGDLSSQD